MFNSELFSPITDQMLLSNQERDALADLESRMMADLSSQKFRDDLEADDIVGRYFKDIYTDEELTAYEELTLGKAIFLGKIAEEQINFLNNQTESEARFDTPQEMEFYLHLLANIVMQASVAKDIFFHFNTRLVVFIAKTYLNQEKVPFLDLIQDGNIGLLRAIDKYDYRKGFRFSTYASHIIRQAIARGFAEQSRDIRLPADKVIEARFLKKIRTGLEVKLGRTPTISEITEEASHSKPELNLTDEKVANLLRVDSAALRLNAPLSEDYDSDEFGDKLPSDDESVESHAEKKLLKTLIAEALNSGVIHDKHSKVLRMRFGIGSHQPMSYVEIGKVMNLSNERIRQIEAYALFQLRKSGLGIKLRDFMK